MACGLQAATFSSDAGFLQAHTEVVVLGTEPGGPRVAVAPAWQGRVMTSTSGGAGNSSYGWINREVIARGIVPEEEREGLERHIHVFGGEDRFWIGPEGGQFAYYFEPDSAFEFENWFVPPFIDTEPWTVTQQTETSIRLEHVVTLPNWSGHPFSMKVVRDVVLVSPDELPSNLQVPAEDGVSLVAYESNNRLENLGDVAWTRDTGLPSIWILGMFNHGARTVVVVPYRPGSRDEAGKIVNDDYFGAVAADRLKVDETHRVIYFSGDGASRGKIGVNQARSRGVAGSWDPDRGVLTVIRFNQPDEPSPYVNSSWALQDDPFSGDVINSYNDGPIDGDQLGPFYELESSSPGLALEPGQSWLHTHQTIHYEGDRVQLDALATRILGVGLAAIESALTD
jgi:hypothetical protein